MGTYFLVSKHNPYLKGCGAVLVSVGVLGILVYEYRVARSWCRTREARQQPWRYQIGDTSFRYEGAGTEIIVEWGGVATILIGRHAWILRLVAKKSLAIPRAAFSADDRKRIDSFFGAGVPGLGIGGSVAVNTHLKARSSPE
jgi:hypothetical protein